MGIHIPPAESVLMAEESRKCNAALVAIFLQFGVLLAALRSASTDNYEELYDVVRNGSSPATFLNSPTNLTQISFEIADQLDSPVFQIGPLDDNTCVYYTGSNVSLVLYEGTCEQVDACKFDICSDTWGLAWSVSVSLGAAVALATGLMKYCHEQTPPENDDQWTLSLGFAYSRCFASVSPFWRPCLTNSISSPG